jgi:hypothetical protein
VKPFDAASPPACRNPTPRRTDAPTERSIQPFTLLRSSARTYNRRLPDLARAVADPSDTIGR